MNDFSTIQCSDRLNNSTNSASKLKAQNNQKVDSKIGAMIFAVQESDSRYERNLKFDILNLKVDISELTRMFHSSVKSRTEIRELRSKVCFCCTNSETSR